MTPCVFEELTMGRGNVAGNGVRTWLAVALLFMVSAPGWAAEREQADLYLWRPKTIAIGSAGVGSPHLAAYSRHLGANERIVFRAGRSGSFYVEIRQTGGRSGAYRLSVVRAPKR